MQQNNEIAYVQTEDGDVPAKAIFLVGIIKTVGLGANGGDARNFTISYGAEGVEKTYTFNDDNHLVRGRLEAIRDAVKAKVAAVKR